ncbi:MAG TPA: nitroreductase family protein [Allosphingosinicella sp.]|nr:nitroreductase family protein [Allosphingosinicella sp.]
MTNVTEALGARFSCRAFLDRPVERALIEEIIALAARAPSGGNLQPWHVDVLAGDALDALKAAVRDTLAAAPQGEPLPFAVYPSPLPEPWHRRRADNGEALHASVGIAREDRPARRAQFVRNYDFFGAPVGLFFSIGRLFDRPQWAHLGMFIANVMLLAEERGLATCAQESWAAVHETVERFLAMPAERMLYCGMALGHGDRAHPVNGWRTGRAPLSDFATFRGF